MAARPASACTGQPDQRATGMPRRAFVRHTPRPQPQPPVNPFSILMLGLAMSADAFVAALGKGTSLPAPTLRQALRISLIFGAIAAIMPLIGWRLGAAAAPFIRAWDHWAAFALLSLLGGAMIHQAIAGEDESTPPVDPSPKPQRDGLLGVALTGLATSIDAMAVGVGLAFIDVDILTVAIVIGLCTSTMVAIGILAGRALGRLIGKWSEIAGGIVLILVGATILHEHLRGGA